MRAGSIAIVAASVALLPGAARGDRGALTLDVGPALTWWPSMPPSLGTGSGVGGTSGGGLVGVRYAPRDDLEVTLSGFYEAQADFTNTATTLRTDAGPFTGTFTSRLGRWGVLGGARLVRGLVWRWFVGGEVGWALQDVTRQDLVNVSDPANPHSFGLGLQDRSRGALVVSPLAGVEWQVTDHWSAAFTSRIQALVGGTGRAGVVLALGVGYSWYGL